MTDYLETALVIALTILICVAVVVAMPLIFAYHYLSPLFRPSRR
jgi:hypothetical protein